MSSSKKYIVYLAKILLFLFLFVSVYTYTRDAFCGNTSDSALRTIVKHPNNTFDVILAGPSHIKYAIEPAQLFGEHGFVSCNTASPAQSIPSTYYVVKEMIQRHDPELVVLDLFTLFCPDKYLSTTRVHQALDAFPLSLTKIQAINDLLEDGKNEYYCHYMLYHGRWKHLTEEDYVPSAAFHETYRLRKGVTPFPAPFVPVSSEETAEIPEIPLDYLQRIVQLCKETDTQLLLTVIPYRADVDNNNTSAILQQKMFNKVEQLAKEWDVDYLNGLHCLEEMDFDFMTDMLEDSHVNASGSEKVSAFYGDYLAEHYDLPDRSQEKKFAHWHEAYAGYLVDLEACKALD